MPLSANRLHVVTTAAIVTITLGAACATPRGAAPTTTAAARAAAAPAWVTHPPVEAGALYGVGHGTSLETARDSARGEALKSLRADIETVSTSAEGESTGPAGTRSFLDAATATRVAARFRNVSLPFETVRHESHGGEHWVLLKLDLASRRVAPRAGAAGVEGPLRAALADWLAGRAWLLCAGPAPLALDMDLRAEVAASGVAGMLVARGSPALRVVRLADGAEVESLALGEVTAQGFSESSARERLLEAAAERVRASLSPSGGP